MCGASYGDIDDVTGKSVKFHVKLITCGDFTANEEHSKIQVLCSTCEGCKEPHHVEAACHTASIPNSAGGAGGTASRPGLAS